MIERQTVNGKPAVVAYLTRNHELTTPDRAEVVKVMYDDGTITYGVRPEAGQARRVKLDAEWDEQKHPRDDHGKFSEAPGGGEGGGSPAPTSPKEFYRALSEKRSAEREAKRAERTAKASATIQQHETTWRQAAVNPIERAVWVDGRGVQRAKDGEATQVHFTPEETKYFKGATFTHNHPSGGSFSPNDIDMAAKHKMAEMRAFDARGTAGTGYSYSMKPGEKGWPRGVALTKMLQRAEELGRERFARVNPEVLAGRVSASEAGLHHWHDVWTTVASEYGMKYTRVKR